MGSEVRIENGGLNRANLSLLKATNIVVEDEAKTRSGRIDASEVGYPGGGRITVPVKALAAVRGCIPIREAEPATGSWRGWLW